MKHPHGRAAATLLLTLVIGACASVPPVRTWSPGIAVGPGIPLGVFGDSMELGIGLQVGVQAKLPKDGLSLRASVAYQSFGDHEKHCTNTCSNTGRRSRLLTSAVDLLASPAREWPVVPYALIGVGYNRAGDHSSTILILKPSPIGLQVGAGLELRYREHPVYFEGRILTSSPGAVAPIMLGVRW
jgi:hypothetical protein